MGIFINVLWCKENMVHYMPPSSSFDLCLMDRNASAGLGSRKYLQSRFDLLCLAASRRYYFQLENSLRVSCISDQAFPGIWRFSSHYLMLICLLIFFRFFLWIAQCTYCICPCVHWHLAAHLSMNEFEYSLQVCDERPLVVYNHPPAVCPFGCFIPLPNSYSGSHLLHSMFLLYFNLSALNTFLCLSPPLLSTDTTVSSQKGKTALHQSPVNPCAFSNSWHVGASLCMSVSVLTFS